MQIAIETMLNMQDSMNSRVHEDWINQRFEWYRAVWIECGELIDHAGYKWWKKQDPDLEQVRLEVVDIWHFGMSALFGTQPDLGSLAKAIELDLYHAEPEYTDIRLATEALAQNSLETKSFSVALFAQLMFTCDLSFEDLYRHYIGKNVLNFFRQDHGYKEGSYIKIWEGREDNEHLSQILTTLDPASETFPDDVYESLLKRYPGEKSDLL